MRLVARAVVLAAIVVSLALASLPAAADTSPPATTATTVAPPPLVVPPIGQPPATTETTSPGDAQPTGGEHPGFFDIGGRVRAAVNDWFRGLVMAAVNPTLDYLGHTLLATPDFTGAGRVRDLWFVSWGIANTIFVLLVIAGGAVVMGHETFQTRYTVKELAPRIALGWVSANASLTLAGVAITFANALSRAFVAGGVGDGDGAAATMRTLILGALAGGDIFVTLVGLVVVALALGLLGVYVVRVCTMVVLVAGAPLFLVGHALPQTEGAARLWWRAMLGCLAVQVGQALILATAVRVFFDADGRRLLGLPGGGLADLLVSGCLFWMMLRLPSYARRLVFNTRPNAGAQAVRYLVVDRGVRAARTALKAAAA